MSASRELYPHAWSIPNLLNCHILDLSSRKIISCSAWKKCHVVLQRKHYNLQSLTFFVLRSSNEHATKRGLQELLLLLFSLGALAGSRAAAPCPEPGAAPSEAAGASGALARGLFRAPAQFPAVELAVSKRFSNFDRLGAVTASLGLGLLHCRTTFWTQTFS